MLLPNNFYLSHILGDDDPTRVYDLSSLSLSPPSDGQIHLIQPVTTLKDEMLGSMFPVQIFLPFFHDDFASILFRSESDITVFKLSVPLAPRTNRMVVFSRVLSTFSPPDFMGRDKYASFVGGDVARSTVGHLVRHPESSRGNSTRYAYSRWPPRIALELIRSYHYDCFTNRMMSVFSDGVVRIIDLVL